MFYYNVWVLIYELRVRLEKGKTVMTKAGPKRHTWRRLGPYVRLSFFFLHFPFPFSFSFFFLWFSPGWPRVKRVDWYQLECSTGAKLRQKKSKEKDGKKGL